MKQTDSKRRHQAMETREKIFNTAIALAEEKGINGFTIDDIQERTGFSRGLFYNYFRSINDILSEIVGANECQYQTIKEEYLTDTRGIEKILLFIQYIGALHSDPALKDHLRVHYANILKNERLSRYFLNKNRFIYVTLLEALQECKEDGKVGGDTNLEQATSDIVVILRGSILQYLFSSDGTSYDIAAQAARLTASYLSGICTDSVSIPIPPIHKIENSSRTSNEYFSNVHKDMI